MSEDPVAALEPRSVWGLFSQITRVPRCSGKEEGIRRWARDWAGRQGIPCREDAAGNLLLHREASAGGQGVPALVLQAHLDMVCAKSPESPIDLERDPIPVRLQGSVVRAEGTTLGADNGIGLALCLAALAEAGGVHGPLEALLTVDEEAGMKGAFGLKPGFFSGSYLLNLDSEELGLITIGTAGGQYTDYALPVRRGPAPGRQALEVSVAGLRGGHSGMDIHLPRLNAIRLVQEAAAELLALGPVRIGRLEGGAASNVIPSAARCTLLVPEEEAARRLATLEEWRTRTLAAAREAEPGLTIRVGPATEPGAYGPEESARLCRLLAEIPHGPLAFSQEIEGLVETSNNLAQAKSGDEVFEVFTSARSCVEAALEELGGRLKAMGERHGARVKQHTRYPAWTANPRSSFTLLVKEQYEAVLGREVELKAYHAGLECGVFKGVAPQLEMASLGPAIRGVHTTGEEVEVASVSTIWRVLLRIVEHMGELR